MDTEIKTLPVDLNNLAVQCPDSHKIHAYEYHAESRGLYVQYKSNANRVTYLYPDHPAEDAAALEAAESKGKHFNREWVNAHPLFEKLPGTTQIVVWPSKETTDAGKEAA